MPARAADSSASAKGALASTQAVHSPRAAWMRHALAPDAAMDLMREVLRCADPADQQVDAEPQAAAELARLSEPQESE